VLFCANLLFGFQFYQHLGHQLDAIVKKIDVAIKAYIAKVLFQCYSWVGHLSASFLGFGQPYGSTRWPFLSILFTPLYETLSKLREMTRLLV
jgi:hypothetical protein